MVQSALAELAKINYFRVEVGKKLPKKFPEPPPVSKQDAGSFALSFSAEALEAKIA